jgi:hypothetical protein
VTIGTGCSGTARGRILSIAGPLDLTVVDQPAEQLLQRPVVPGDRGRIDGPLAVTGLPLKHRGQVGPHVVPRQVAGALRHPVGAEETAESATHPGVGVDGHRAKSNPLMPCVVLARAL